MILDPLKKVQPITQKGFYLISDILDEMEITHEIHRANIAQKAQGYLTRCNLDPRKVFQDSLGDWLVTESMVAAVIAVLLPVYGNRDKIIQAKVELGLMDEPATKPVLAIVENAKPIASVPAPESPLAVFSYGASEVRTQLVNGEPWFCLTDVSNVLGVKNPRDFLNSDFCDPRGVGLIYTTDSLGRNQSVNFISEPNLYALIMRSRKKEAVAFQRWITGEVIPTIRKTGTYSIAEAPALPTDFKSALVALLAEVEKSEEQKGIILELTPKAAFHDRVTEAAGCHTFQEAAKILGTGQNRLYKFCYDQHIMIKKSRLPYQRFKDAGYFQVIEVPYVDSDGIYQLGYKTLITGRGLSYLQKQWDQAKAA